MENIISGSVIGTLEGLGTITGTINEIVTGSIKTNCTGELKVYTDDGEPLYFTLNIII